MYGRVWNVVWEVVDTVNALLSMNKYKISSVPVLIPILYLCFPGISTSTFCYQSIWRLFYVRCVYTVNGWYSLQQKRHIHSIYQLTYVRGFKPKWYFFLCFKVSICFNRWSIFWSCHSLTVPPQPGNFQGVSDDPYQITLNWTAPDWGSQPDENDPPIMSYLLVYNCSGSGGSVSIKTLLFLTFRTQLKDTILLLVWTLYFKCTCYICWLKQWWGNVWKIKQARLWDMAHMQWGFRLVWQHTFRYDYDLFCSVRIVSVKPLASYQAIISSVKRAWSSYCFAVT